MSRETHTLSVLPGDWDRWKELAWASRLSLSEYIRRAVEAYGEQSARAAPSESAPERDRR